MVIRKQRLEEFLAAFNAHDEDGVMQFFADDCVFETPRGTHPWGERLVGREAVRAGVQGRFDTIPDVRYDDAEHWLVDGHAVSKWSLRGTTTDGDRIDVRGCDLFDLDQNGLITRKDSYWKIVSG